MRMPRSSDEEFLLELQALLQTDLSIFGFKLLDSVDSILRRRLVPVRLNYAGHQLRVTVVCTEDPYDFVFHDKILPLSFIAEMNPPVQMALDQAVNFLLNQFKLFHLRNFRNNDDISAMLRDLNALKSKKRILRYELAEKNLETVIYVELPIPILRFLRPVYAREGRGCNADSCVLRMVLDSLNNNVLKKYGVQFSNEVADLVSENEKKIKDLSFTDLSSFVEDLDRKIKDILETILNKYALREDLFHQIFAVFHPLDMIKGVNTYSMNEMDVMLGNHKVLKINLRNTFPTCLPLLTIFRGEIEEETGEINPKRSLVKKMDVFGSEKDPDTIARNIIEFIQRESLLQ